MKSPEHRNLTRYHRTLEQRSLWLLVAVSAVALPVGLVLVRFFVNLVMGN